MQEAQETKKSKKISNEKSKEKANEKANDIKKQVAITIKGIQKMDDESDTTELFTLGDFYKKNSHYYISYNESETTGFQNSKTVLKIEGNNKVTLMRSGDFRSHLIVEKGNRNVGLYVTEAGELSIGVSAKVIDSKLNDDGGDLFFSYSLDVNTSLLSENEVAITIRNQ